MTVKIVWKVAPEPTGRYRSFEHRAWPHASYGKADGRPAAWIQCEDEYVPRKVKLGDHKELTIILAHHQHPDRGVSWKRMVLKRRASTYAEAQELVQAFLDAHPEFHPLEDKA